MSMSKNQKDKFARALAGFFILALLLIQKLFSWDLTLLIVLVGFNLLQYGFTGWCPFALYLEKIGWYQNNKKESL